MSDFSDCIHSKKFLAQFNIIISNVIVFTLILFPYLKIQKIIVYLLIIKSIFLKHSPFATSFYPVLLFFSLQFHSQMNFFIKTLAFSDFMVYNIKHIKGIGNPVISLCLIPKNTFIPYT